MASVYPSTSSNNGSVLFHNISSKSQFSSNRSATSKQTSTDIATQPDADIYLNRLITFKSIFGITYFGRYFHNYHNEQFHYFRPLLIASLVLYDLLSMAAMLYLEYHAFSEYIYSKLFRHSLKKLTMNIVFRSSGYCIMLEFVCIKLLTLIRGPTLINTISTLGQGIRMSSASLSRYYLVYLVIIVEAVMHSVAFVLMFKPMIENTSPLNRWLLSIFYAMEGVIYGATKSCICSLHMYASVLVCERISDNKSILQRCPNFGLMLEDMLQLKNKLSDLNNTLSLTLLIKVMINGILLSSSVCAFEDKMHDKILDIESLVALALLFSSQLVDEVISCISSQSIANGMDNLIRAIQEMTAQQCTEFLHLTNTQQSAPSSVEEDNELNRYRLVEDVEYRCLQHICSMKDSFCYNVMNMFDLRSVTVLVILSNVCNYSVLLIQTSEAE